MGRADMGFSFGYGWIVGHWGILGRWGRRGIVEAADAGEEVEGAKIDEENEGKYEGRKGVAEGDEEAGVVRE